MRTSCAVRSPAALLAVAACAVFAPSAARAADKDSIYQIHPIIDGAAIGTSLALTIGIYVFAAGSIETRCPCDPAEINVLDRWAVNFDSGAAGLASDLTVGAILIAPAVADVMALRRWRPILEDFVVYAEAIAISGAMVTAAKQSGRPFPLTYQGDPSLIGTPDGYRSFYSGHTTLAFTALATMSMTIGERYGHYLVPWLLTLGLGAAIGIERVAAGAHFPTDVVVGALYGTAVGVLVPAVHYRRLDIIPAFASDGRGGARGVPGLALVGRF